MSAAKTNAPNRFWEYLLVIWWLLAVVFTAFAIVYVASDFGFFLGITAGAVTFAVMYVVRTIINIRTGGQFNEKYYLR